ncbi:MAG TPA: putative lipid II flippase FtsW [Solirubrobacterales bacterium]|nr:putative lipid II flippase FtsW [Solirubrobacterales bacterium]
MSGRAAPKRRTPPPLEYSLLLTATLCLLAVGAVMVFSASSAASLLSAGGGDGFYYLKRTLLFAAIGLVALRLASVNGVRVSRPLIPLLVGLSLFLLFCVLVPGVGQTVNGSQRWLGTGLFTFQPSELLKVSLILYGAHLLASEPKRIRSLHGLAPYLAVVGLALLLVGLQPDLGTAMTVTCGVTCLLLASGVAPRTLAPVAAVAGVALIALIASNPYQQERLTGFIDPGGDPGGAGYQSLQAEIALGSGGVMGVGLGESVQKAFYLPEAHTDMVSAVFGEETGFAGMIVLIGLFGMFGYAGFRAAHRARDRYSKLLAAGLTSLILGQATINLFAVLGLAPLTGVPLPFVSYGGTSLIVTLTAAGLILNVARRPAAAGASSRPKSGSRRSRAAGERLRVVEGGGEKIRRRRAGSDTGRDSGRRHSGPRGAGHRRRRRAAR